MIRELKNSGLTITEISKRLGIDRKTARSAINKKSPPTYQRKASKTILDEFKPYINSRLELYNLTSQKLHEELQNQGFSGKYGIVNNYVQKVKADYKTKAVMRFETIPGEQAQVDWGYFGEFYDCDKKKFIRLCCFVMILGYSRTRFIHFFDGDNTTNFLKGHNLAFEYFGGYPREILYDNLKSVVIKRAFKQKDSEFNKEFMEFAGFYGFKPILAAPYRPQTKGKVEITVRYVRDNFFEGEDFRSLSEINSDALSWLYKVNSKIHGTTHEAPLERLKRENLTPIVGKFYDLSTIYYRKVGIDCHFSFKANFYSTPIEYAGKEVVIKEVDDGIHVVYREQKIAFHKLEENYKGIYITSPSHHYEIKLTSEKRSKQAWKNRSRDRKIKNKELEQIEYKKINFNSNQLLRNFEEVQSRDLNIYQELC